MRALRHFADHLAQRECRTLPQMGSEHLTAFAAWLSRKRVPCGHREGELWAPQSVLTWTNTVRRFLRWVARADYTLLDWSLWMAPVKVPRTLPRVLSRAEVDRLFATASGPGPVDLRD